MGRTASITILLLAACHPAIGQNASPLRTAFHWLSPSKDVALFERIRTAFTEELKPDDPATVKPYVAQEYKWISKVGVYEQTALVLIGERETRTSTYRNYFLAFSFDLKTGEKTPLTSSNNGFLAWRFKTLVRFNSSEPPDVVFTYPSCMECEADYLLSSFRLDLSDGKWKVRSWGENGREILIGSDYSVDEEENFKEDCVFKFADFNNDGSEDLAVRCQSISEKGKILEDSTSIYTIQRGQPQIIRVMNPQQLATIREKLCVDARKSKMCPSN